MGDILLGAIAVVAVSIGMLWAEGRTQARCDEKVRILLEGSRSWWYPADLVISGAGSFGYVCAALGRLDEAGLVERHPRQWSYRWKHDGVVTPARPTRSRVPSMGRLMRASG